jgi:hypothetical protein
VYISSIGASAPSFASVTSSPTVQLLQAQQQADGALFGAVSGEPSDLSSLTASAQAYSLYLDPSLLVQLQQWDGTETTGSERAAAAATAAPAPTAPPSPFTFNPFDEQSWWTDPSGQNVDMTA